MSHSSQGTWMGRRTEVRVIYRFILLPSGLPGLVRIILASTQDQKQHGPEGVETSGPQSFFVESAD
jgi:hypothetical protein